MKKYTHSELLALVSVLKLECHGLILARAMKPLIDDEELKNYRRLVFLKSKTELLV